MFNLRPLQTRAFQAMRNQRKLIMPIQQAQFGGMMGMGDLADIMAGKCDPNDAIELWDMEDRSGILLTLSDRKGALNDAL